MQLVNTMDTRGRPEGAEWAGLGFQAQTLNPDGAASVYFWVRIRQLEGKAGLPDSHRNPLTKT